MGFLSDLFFAGGSICSVRTSILVSLLPVVIIGLGAKHLFDCPKQPVIPIYLLVGGVTFLSLLIFPIFYCSQDGKPILPCQILNFLLLLFGSICFITGSVFVYMSYEPNYKSRSSVEYCDRMVYQVAFWITNAIYISISLMLLYYCYKAWTEKRAREKCYISTVDVK